MSKDMYLKIVNDLAISKKSKEKLKNLSPLNYIGIASILAKS
jgi:hypothetical protein